MNRQTIKIMTLVAFIATGLVIAALIIVPDFFDDSPKNETYQTRVVIPRTMTANERAEAENNPERMAYEDNALSKVALREGEFLLTVITQNFDTDPLEEQIIAYRKPGEVDSPVYLSYIDFDDTAGSYKRIWDTATPVIRAGTLNLYTNDMIGDRSLCLIVMGMNAAGEQTLTVFRKPPEQGQAGGTPASFYKIAELSIDGTIVIKEAARTTAYETMFSRGASHSIATYGRDYDSANIMDQIETTYTFNPVNGLYERSSVARIPGIQIEQRQVRELLSGSKEKFEGFITGLWYFVSPQGSMNQSQYVYFDPEKREIIFFGEDTHQVFIWQTSTSTRYGLYVGSQNSNVATLRRNITIELESLESIRMSIHDDVRLRIGITNPWNGTYRKANKTDMYSEKPGTSITSHFDASYEGYIGKFMFSGNGNYQLQKGTGLQEGKYAFFSIDGTELLELRPQNIPGLSRDLYRIERDPKTGAISNAKELTLYRVRMGTKGIQELHEAAISLTKTEE